MRLTLSATRDDVNDAVAYNPTYRRTRIFTCVSYAEARNSYRPSVRPSVCLSVCLSHAGVVSKRLNILSCFLHHTIAHSF